MAEVITSVFKIGDKIRKVSGDYQLDGVVVSVFTKLDGKVRYVVEHEPGFLHIYTDKNLQRIESPTQTLASRLLEALQHVNSCAQCNQADWQDCDSGGKEAFEVKKEAEKILKM